MPATDETKPATARRGAMEAERDSLRLQLEVAQRNRDDALEKWEADHKALTTERDDLKEKLAAKEREAARIFEALGKVETERDEAQSRRAALETTIQTYKDRNLVLQQEHAVLSAQTARAENTKHDLVAACDTLQAKLLEATRDRDAALTKLESWKAAWSIEPWAQQQKMRELLNEALQTLEHREDHDVLGLTNEIRSLLEPKL
jgi:hypothetical protein